MHYTQIVNEDFAIVLRVQNSIIVYGITDPLTSMGPYTQLEPDCSKC